MNSARMSLLPSIDRQKYSSDILWAAITGGDPHSDDITSKALSLVIPQFTECLVRPEYLRRIPLETIRKCIRTWIDQISFPKEVLNLSNGIRLKCDTVREELEVIDLMLREIVKFLLPGFELDEKQSLHALEKEYEEKRMEKTNDETGKVDQNRPEQNAQVSGDEDAFEFDSKDPVTYIRETLLEIGVWLRNSIGVFEDIARNPIGTGSSEEQAWRAPGQLELDVNNLQHVKELSAGCLRLNLLADLQESRRLLTHKGSLGEKDYRKGGKGKITRKGEGSDHKEDYNEKKFVVDNSDEPLADISVVYNIISECDRAMALYDCFDR